MKLCRRCGHRLTTKDVTPGYKYYCPNCDEDMFGIEARDVPVVVVKDLGDGRLATHTSYTVVKVAPRKWTARSSFYNLVAGRFDGFDMTRGIPLRTRKEAARVARWYTRWAWNWNWWLCSPDHARRQASRAGVMLRIVERGK